MAKIPLAGRSDPAPAPAPPPAPLDPVQSVSTIPEGEQEEGTAATDPTPPPAPPEQSSPVELQPEEPAPEPPPADADATDELPVWQKAVEKRLAALERVWAAGAAITAAPSPGSAGAGLHGNIDDLKLP